MEKQTNNNNHIVHIELWASFNMSVRIVNRIKVLAYRNEIVFVFSRKARQRMRERD